MGIKKFAGALALQLLSCASSLLSDEPNPVSVDTDRSRTTITSSTTASSLSLTPDKNIELRRPLVDANQGIHRLAKLPMKATEVSKRKGSMTRKCKICLERGIRHDVSYYCFDCGMTHSYCSPDMWNKSRDCFAEHVRQIKRIVPKRKRQSEREEIE